MNDITIDRDIPGRIILSIKGISSCNIHVGKNGYSLNCDGITVMQEETLENVEKTAIAHLIEKCQFAIVRGQTALHAMGLLVWQPRTLESLHNRILDLRS